MHDMKCIDEIPAADLKGKLVLVRGTLDLPLDDAGQVSDTFRLTQACKTIDFLSSAGAKVVLIGKIGRDPQVSMAPVAEAMKKRRKVFFVPDILGAPARSAVAAMQDGDVVLLENLQQDPREVAGDDSFAQELASFGEMYVNDAFLSAHRASASMIGIPRFLPSFAGIQFCEEIREIDAARAPLSPSFAILGGAKFETKEPLIKLLLEKYDHVFIAGALANDVFKAQGLEVGRSLISEQSPDASVLDHEHFLAPIDVMVENAEGQARVKKPDAVEPGEKIVDIGPDSVAMIAPLIARARFILWNGPTGLYEEGYAHYTHAIAELVAKSDARKVIGGGDTIAAIQESDTDEKRLGFLSTGGGAMLEYLLKGTLPGIEALG